MIKVFVRAWFAKNWSHLKYMKMNVSFRLSGSEQNYTPSCNHDHHHGHYHREDPAPGRQPANSTSLSNQKNNYLDNTEYHPDNPVHNHNPTNYYFNNSPHDH